MSDKVTVESLRAEALAWHATAERYRHVLIKILGYAQPEFKMMDEEVRACIAQVVEREPGVLTGDAQDLNPAPNLIPAPDLTPSPSLKGRDEDAVERFYSDVEG